LKVALIGLLQSGKSTLLSAISGKAMPPPGGFEIEEAIVPVGDERLDWLAEVFKPKKIVHATIDCLDLPGFNFADERGRHAAHRIIEHIRTVDLLVLVVRAFDNPEVGPYRNRIDAVKDLQELKTELLLADLELVATRIEKLEKQVHKPTKTQADDKAELALHLKLQGAIESEKPISSAIETEAERIFGPAAEGMEVIRICAELERQLSQLDAKSKKEFMADLGIEDSAVEKFVKGCYSTLGLISFLTHGGGEVRAWPVKKGTTALDAAGKVHSDIKRGFIRAETMHFDDLKELGDEKAVKAAGRVRLEGKEYIVQDGDIINFRFNV